MTGQLSAQIAHQRVMETIHQAEHHRRSHAEQLDRLGGRWIPFTPRRPRAAIASALVSHDPCH